MSRPTLTLERKLWIQNIKYVIGVDEVGRGAFAGPIVAGAVVLPQIMKISKKIKFLKEINDSKLLKAKTRRKLAKIIKKHAIIWAVDEVGIPTINKLGVGRANYMVFRKVVSRVLSQIDESSCFLLCDGFRTRYVRKIGLKKQMAIIDGDKKSITIAAASIIAKVHRDSLMRKLAKIHPYYKLSRNKGYGTRGHQKALRLYGLTKIHRTSFDLNKFLSQPI